MKCPNCDHVSDTALIKCSSCSEVFERRTLEDLRHIDYLLEWIRSRRLDLGEIAADRFLRETEAARAELLAQLLPEPEIVPEPQALTEEPLDEPALEPQEQAHLLTLLAGEALAAQPEAPLEWPEPVAVVQAEPSAPPAPAAVMRQPAPLPAPKPKEPPKPREPLIRWDQVWGKVVEAAVSGLLLRWLRFLGAFLFVVSLGIVVVNFWSQIPPWGQVLIIFFIPAAFYGGGWALRRRLGIVQTGGVLMGVGLVLLAVDFAAIYQFGGLTVAVNIYWLISSVVCMVVYGLTLLFVVREEFFGYIGLAGIGSTVMAGAALIEPSVQWPLAALAGFGVLSVEAGFRLGRGGGKWRELGDAARRFPQIVIPMVLLALLMVPGDAARPAQAVAFVLATLAAGLLTFRYPNWVYTHTAVWLSVLAVIFILRALRLPWMWYPHFGIGLSLIYVLAYRSLTHRLAADLPERRLNLLAFGAAGAAALLLGMGAGLVVVFTDYWPGVIALASGSLVIAVYAVLFRQPVLVLGAGGLAVVPVSLAAWEWLAPLSQRFDWLMSAWGGLALAYLLITLGLRRKAEYGQWLAILAHTLTAVSLIAIAGYSLFRTYVTNLPILAVLGGALAVYGLSAAMNHGKGHPGLAGWTGDLVKGLRSSVFLYPLAAIFPIFAAVAWSGSLLVWSWLGVLLGAVMIAYIALGQRLHRVDPAYRLPFHGAAYFIGAAAVLVSLEMRTPLTISLYLVVAGLAGLAWVYRHPLETGAAGLLVLWPFGLSMSLLNILPHAYAIGYMLLAGLVFVPMGARLRKLASDQGHHWPLFFIGYGVSVVALLMGLGGRAAGFLIEAPGIGFAVALLAGVLYVYSTYTVDPWFAWAAVIVFPLGLNSGLEFLRIRPEWYAPVWAGFAFLYLGLWVLLKRRFLDQSRNFHLPLHLGSWALAAWTLLLTLSDSADALFYGSDFISAVTLTGSIAAQLLLVGFLVLAAYLYRSGLPLFLEPWLAFLPVTLAFIAYGEGWFGAALRSAHFGLVWAGLGLVHLAVALGLDQREKVRRELRGQLYGVHLGAYLLSGLAVLWSIGERVPFLWSFGSLIAIFSVSAYLVHKSRHPAWEAIARLSLGTFTLSAVPMIRDVFFWLAAWSLPIWATLLLWQLGVVVSFGYLGYTGTAIVFLALAAGLRRMDRTYAWALMSAGGFFTLLALLESAGTTMSLFGFRRIVSISEGEKALVLGYVIVQTLAAVYWAGSSAYYAHKIWAARLFSILAAALVWVPYSLAWQAFGFGDPAPALGFAWIGLAAALLLAGFGLDWLERRRDGQRRVGYAHGPYLSGYLGLAYALLWSWPDRVIALYVLGGGIVLSLLSHAAVYYRRHDSWRDFEGLFAGRGEAIQTVVRTGFLWIAAYAIPVWLVNLLAYHGVPLSWRGLALALAAPVYLAAGLAIRPRDPGATWPLFSAAYLLSAVGAMLSFEDQVLAIYVLALDAVVYAASAYIFRQSVWLYLTNILVPIVVLLAVHHRLGALPAEWLAGGFMGLAVVDLAIGWLFDRGREMGEGVSPFALAFYGPGYLLSALALAASSEGRELAIVIFLVGVGVYTWSARHFREPVFLYPAVWLAAVPYYLGMTYTRLDPAWYGLGWLPLIAAALAAGRVYFHKQREIKDLAHPAMPFYILVYALSVSMILISRGDMLALTAAFSAAAALYLFSASLFRRAWWLYPGLLAFHAAVLSFFNLETVRLPLAYQPVYLLPVTLAMGFLWGRLWKPLRKPLQQKPRALEVWSLWDRLGSDWATPYAVFAGINVAAGQAVGLFRWESGIVIALGHAVLFGVLAWQLTGRRFVWGSIAFFLLGLGLRLAWAGLAWPRLGMLAAGIGFGVYVIAWAAEVLAGRLPDKRIGEKPHPRLAIWVQPLERTGIALNLGGLAIALVIFPFGAEIAIALAFSGALLLGISYRQGRYPLGYLGVALMEVAFVLVMLGEEVRQPQWYAIPAGLYFIGVAFFERRRGQKSFALLLESFGLVVILLTSFVQSLDPEAGFRYFLLLLVETIVVIAWSAQQQRKAPFLIGAGGVLANVVGQVVVVFLGEGALIRWLIFGGLGLIILLAAIFAERWVIPRAKEVRERLEGWA